MSHQPPIPQLLARARAELSAAFDFSKPMRVSRAPGRLDVMGGIADYTGSLVCELPLAAAAAVLLQPRSDRELQIFSFNLFDAHEPFTFRISLDALASSSVAQLRDEFAQPARHFAAYIAGCLKLLHEIDAIDLTKCDGLNLAILSDVPIGAGVSSSAAIEVATMINLIDHFNLRDALDGLATAALCQRVENEIAGAPCGIMDQVTSCLGESSKLLRMKCQPHEILPPLQLPIGFRVLGIDSRVKHRVGGGQYGQTRCAAFMAHRIILERMTKMGTRVGRELLADPMQGYLANLDPDDYKKFFRPSLPEIVNGEAFIAKFKETIDPITQVQEEVDYYVRSAADHHVLEAQRVQRFCEFVEQSVALPLADTDRFVAMDKAGHLMYASHLSYTNDARLGADECDLLVKLVRDREKAGLYGAKITGGGSGGTVAVLCEIGERTDRAIAEILNEYQKQTGLEPRLISGSSDGAWSSGTQLLK